MVAVGEIGATDAATEQGISAEEHLRFGYIVCQTAWGVPGNGNGYNAAVAKEDFVAIVQYFAKWRNIFVISHTKACNAFLCLVDSADHCDIYDSEGNCCSVAGYRAYDKTTALGKDIVPLKGADNSISFFTVKGEFLYSLPKEVDKIGALRGNVIPVHNKECQKWGLIDLSGQLISGYKYDAIEEGVIERCVDPSSTHKTFRSIDFLDIYERELQIFKRDGGETIIGDDGQESLPLLKGFVVVDKDSPNLFQFYDEENKKTKLLRIENGVAVWSASFDHIVLNKIIVGDLAGGREGLIDKKTFEILLPPIFDRAENNNRPAANLEGKWYRFSSDMSLINPATAYDDAFKDLDMCYY